MLGRTNFFGYSVCGLSLVLGAAACADAAVTIPWVTVGNPGNPSDANGPGAVDHVYQIGKYDVTNSQYVEFLNAVDPTGANAKGIYDSRMTSYPDGKVVFTGGIDLNANAADGFKYAAKAGQANFPVIWVTFNSAARMANWLNNGQGSSSTESGAYDMSQALPARSANATVFLPSESEWYKAAYYNPTTGYHLYATQSDTTPTSQLPPGGSNSANFVDPKTGYAAHPNAPRSDSLVYLTEVGAYVNSGSFYGTFDQNGNVRQWNEALNDGLRGARGGSWEDSAFPMAANVTFFNNASHEDTGFRLASVPEPACVSIFLIAGAFIGRRRRA